MSEQKNGTSKAKDFDREQETLLSAIGDKARELESGRTAGLLTLARLTAEYVGNALSVAADGMLAKAFTAAVQNVELRLAAVTDDATYGVSRLLGLYGLSSLVDDGPMMGKLLPSHVKQLVRLIRRDATAATVAYEWREEAALKGKALVSECAEGKLSVSALSKRVDKLLGKAAATEPTAEQKASKRLASALKLLHDDAADQRDAILSKLVKGGALDAKDVFAMLKALADNGRLKALQALALAAQKLAKRATGERDETAAADSKSKRKAAAAK